MVKVETFNFIGGTLIANVIKACKTGSLDITHTVVRHQKVLFPAHVYEIIVKWIVCKVVVVKGVQVRLKGRKFALLCRMLNTKNQPTTFRFLSLTQCNASMYCCACHFLVKNGN